MLEDLMILDRKKDTLLFAGKAKASVNNWFIFKDSYTLKNIELENGLINMNRQDSVWNYQYIVDYFAKPKSNKPQKPLNLDVKEVHFKNIRFNKTDGWIGQNLVAAFQQLDVVTDSINLNTKKIVIKEIKMISPVFWQRDYKGNRPPVKDLTAILNKIPIVSAFKWNTGGIEVAVKKITVENGKFYNDKFTERQPYTDRFDGQHIRFDDISGSINDMRFVHDTLFANARLTAKEKNGFYIKNLSSNLKFTPELMEFRNLDLQTNNSKLGDYLAFSYSAFKNDFSNFIENVNMKVHFVPGSVLYSDDLAQFGPSLKSWKRIFYLQGDANGTVANFTASNFKMRTGPTSFEGRLSMRGLPDINNTFIDLNSKSFKTNYNEVAIVLPMVKKSKTPAFYKLGNISYIGNFTGFIKDFVAYGTLSTNLGTLVADLNLKIPAKGKPAYSGKVNTGGFQLGSLLNNKDFGIVAGTVKIKGTGFSEKDVNSNVDASLQKIFYKNYTYQNLNVIGSFSANLFTGHASIADPNVQVSSLDGTLNLNKINPLFTLNALAQKINFKALGFTTQNLTLSGDFDLDFTGNNIDNFLGVAQINNARLLNDNNDISFNSLRLSSSMVGTQKQLSLRSTELDADIMGVFKIMDLPIAFTTFLNRYYPAYLTAPRRQASQEDFTFDIRTKNVEPYLQLVDKKITGFNNSTFSGKLVLGSNALTFNANVPLFSYNGKTFTGTLVEAYGNRDTLHADINVEDIRINDSFHLPGTRLALSAYNNVSDIQLFTKGSKTLEEAELNARIRSFEDGVNIKFLPSSFVINSRKWTLEKDGELTLRKNYIDANQVTFSQGDQQIIIATEFDELNENTHLIAKLTNLNIGDFTPFFVTKPALAGKLSGTTTLYNPFGKTVIDFTGVADSFSVEKNLVGKVNLNASVNLETGSVNFKAKSIEENYDFDLTGGLNFKDSVSNNLNIDFNANRFRLKILEPYLKTIFSSMDGLALGKINVRIENGKQLITGKTNIINGSMVVAYTQCKYLLSNEELIFGKNYIDLGKMDIRDTLGNTGTVKGVMYHDFFQNFSFSGLEFDTDKMLVLNTTKANNPQYYGTVIGRANLTLSGPVTDMRMNIEGAPSTTDSSHVYLPTGAGAESNKVDYIEFIQFGTEMETNIKALNTSNFTLNMNIEANPACKIDVILDEETGDIIKGQGNGKLNIQVGTRDPLRMSGRYDITKGEYTFNFQTFLKKPFSINSGFISWNGDPYLAQISIKAEYLAKNVDISQLGSLAASSAISSNVGQKSDIIILSTLTGVLTKPIIDFEFKLPSGSPLQRDYVIVKRLEDFKNDENLMLNQVASLLLFNSFIINDQSFISQQNTIALATNTIGGVISNWLTSILNRELLKATNGVVSTYIDINPTLDLRSTANQLQANIRGGLKIALTQRLSLLAGGNYDYNNQLSILNRRSTLKPDFTLEWLLNPDGSVRVIGFNRSTIDITNGQLNRTGIQLSYRKDVNTLSDLFRNSKKLKEEERLRNEAAQRRNVTDTL